MSSSHSFQTIIFDFDGTLTLEDSFRYYCLSSAIPISSRMKFFCLHAVGFFDRRAIRYAKKIFLAHYNHWKIIRRSQHKRVIDKLKNTVNLDFMNSFAADYRAILTATPECILEDLVLDVEIIGAKLINGELIEPYGQDKNFFINKIRRQSGVSGSVNYVGDSDSDRETVAVVDKFILVKNFEIVEILLGQSSSLS